MFTLSVAVNCSITIFFACYCIAVEGWRLLYIIGLIEALIFCGLGWLLSGFTVSSNWIVFYARQIIIYNSSSFCMLPWIWHQMRCLTTSGIIIWRMPEVSTTIPSPGGCSTTWQSSSSVFNPWSLIISVSEISRYSSNILLWKILLLLFYSFTFVTIWFLNCGFLSILLESKNVEKF